MKVTVRKDPTLDACTISHDSVKLLEPEDVAEWRAQLMAGMEATLGQGRAYLLVDYTGFSVSPLVAEAYGKVAEELRRRFAKDVFRYGPSDQMSTIAARLQSIKHAYKANVFVTRQQAIAALEKVRSGR